MKDGLVGSEMCIRDRNNSVERPWGILSLFTTCLQLCVISPCHRLCDMWTTSEKHTMKRETLGNANQNKTTRRAGYKKVYEKKHPKEALELKEPDETLNVMYKSLRASKSNYVKCLCLVVP